MTKTRLKTQITDHFPPKCGAGVTDELINTTYHGNGVKQALRNAT